MRSDYPVSYENLCTLLARLARLASPTRFGTQVEGVFRTHEARQHKAFCRSHTQDKGIKMALFASDVNTTDSCVWYKMLDLL